MTTKRPKTPNDQQALDRVRDDLTASEPPPPPPIVLTPEQRAAALAKRAERRNREAVSTQASMTEPYGDDAA